MKLSRTYLFIAISSLALLVVLIIQVNWIFRTAEVKENLFNEKSNMVLARTTEALLADKETCANMEASVGEKEKHTIDSLFNHYMKFYGFHVDYSFEVLSAARPVVGPSQPQACYSRELDQVAAKTGWELKLILPDEEQYIIAEMGVPFITSVVLILVVLGMFWRTTRSLMKEKIISEHTTDFLNNMTHEFKTPLTNIALAGKMIARDPMLSAEDRISHYSGIILEENEKLRLQVEQVLSMTALERGEIPIQKSEMDFHKLITDSVKHIGIQLEASKGALELKLEAENYLVCGDRTHLSNAIRNLVDNAIKYSGDKPDISIQTFNVAKSLVITVSDKGIGVEKQHQQKIFNKYFRVPTGDVHDIKGFGLGLAYVKSIIELHGGAVELESEAGEGSTFKITLPYV